MTDHQRSRTFLARVSTTPGLVVAGLAVVVFLLAPTRVQSDDLNTEQLFQRVDELKTSNDKYDAAPSQKEPTNEFRKYPAHTFWPGQEIWRLKSKVVAKREAGKGYDCEGYPMAIVERAYSFEGSLVTADGQQDIYYWTAPFESKMLKGLRSGQTEEQTVELLGVPFKKGHNSTSWACVDGVVAYDEGPIVYYDCLRVFFEDSKVVGAVMVNRRMCG